MQAVRIAAMIPKHLKKALAARATAEGRTVSAVIRRILERHLEGDAHGSETQAGRK